MRTRHQIEAIIYKVEVELTPKHNSKNNGEKCEQKKTKATTFEKERATPKKKKKLKQSLSQLKRIIEMLESQIKTITKYTLFPRHNSFKTAKVKMYTEVMKRTIFCTMAIVQLAEQTKNTF